MVPVRIYFDPKQTNKRIDVYVLPLLVLLMITLNHGDGIRHDSPVVKRKRECSVCSCDSVSVYYRMLKIFGQN